MKQSNSNFDTPGNFNTTTIHLSDNNLHHFEEAVFKPLMSDSAAKIEINGSKLIRLIFK